jgi:hypothetical protein
MSKVVTLPCPDNHYYYSLHCHLPVRGFKFRAMAVAATRFLCVGAYDGERWCRAFQADASTAEQRQQLDVYMQELATQAPTLALRMRTNAGGLMYCVDHAESDFGAHWLFLVAGRMQASAMPFYNVLEELQRLPGCADQQKLNRFLLDCNTSPEERGKLARLQQDMDATQAAMGSAISGLLDRQQNLEQLDDTVASLLDESRRERDHSRGVVDSQCRKALKWCMWLGMVACCLLVLLVGVPTALYFLGLLKDLLPSWPSSSTNSTL